ncbi:MAG: 50S ribosomal protein L10 [Alphaproteobacteria bacterium]|nr:50S ribosomal protein L10 [Alphaproteobacteria bacterium]
MDRSEKEKLVASLHKTLKGASLVVVTQQVGLTVSEVSDLRRKMRAAGASFKVAKNRLTRRALEGTSFQHLGSLFKGPTAIAYSSDPVAAAKVAVEFSNKNEKLKVIGGGLGEKVLDQNAVKALATLPSLPELRAKILGTIVAPATRLATVIRAPASQLARVMDAKAKKSAEG